MSNVLTKIVNVYPVYPIFTTEPTIRDTVMGVEMSISDIKTCLLRQAKVEEVLESGETVPVELATLEMDTAERLKKEKEERERALLNSASGNKAFKKASAEITRLSGINKENEETIAKLKTTIDDQAGSLTKANEEISELKTKLANAGNVDPQLELDLKKVNAELTEVQATNAALLKEKDELVDKVAELEAHLEEATKPAQ